MRFLADENFPRPTVRALRNHGFETLWTTEYNAGSSDEDVLARCATENRTLLTLDKDFGELVFRRSLPAECGVILFRVDSESPEQFTDFVLATLRRRNDWTGFFTVVQNDRIRMRPLMPSGDV